MRLAALCLLIVAVLGACAGSRIDVAAEAAVLRTRSQALAAAEASQKTDAALAFWAEDAVMQAAGSPQVQGREAIRKVYDGTFRGGQLKEFQGTTSQLVVAQSGDIAYEYGVNRMVFAGPSGNLLDMGKYLAVWKKTNGEWYVAALSFTSDAPAPVPDQSK